MRNKSKQRVAALLSAGVFALSGAAMTLAAGVGMVQPDKSKKTEADASQRDTLILRDGRTIEGKIVSETEKEVTFLIENAGGIRAERVFDRADILEIKRAEKKADGKVDPVAPKPGTGDTSKPSVATADAKAGTKVYVIPFTGSFGRDVALTPIKDVMEDAKKIQPDIIVVDINCEYVVRNSKLPDWVPEPSVYNQLELARQIDPLLTDQIDQSPEWKKKPRLVFWLHKALGGVAFLPFICKEIYYAPEAKHGGIGYLDYLFDGVGDEVVREKQRGARLGRAEGLAIKGGHPPEIVRAMARVDYVLSVNFVGGRPEFHEDTSGEILLTDDGSQQAGRRDSAQDLLRWTGNDVLTLTADMAERLGMSNGTVATEDQLFDRLGITRANPTKVGKAGAILEEWGKGVTEAEFTINRLWREYGKVEVKQPGGFNERTAFRGKRKSILKEIMGYLTKYGESINPEEIGATPDDMIKRIKIIIEELEQTQRRDKPDRK